MMHNYIFQVFYDEKYTQEHNTPKDRDLVKKLREITTNQVLYLNNYSKAWYSGICIEQSPAYKGHYFQVQKYYLMS